MAHVRAKWEVLDFDQTDQGRSWLAFVRTDDVSQGLSIEVGRQYEGDYDLALYSHLYSGSEYYGFRFPSIQSTQLRTSYFDGTRIMGVLVRKPDKASKKSEGD